jgi:hypothetical protein
MAVLQATPDDFDQLLALCETFTIKDNKNVVFWNRPIYNMEDYRGFFTDEFHDNDQFTIMVDESQSSDDSTTMKTIKSFSIWDTSLEEREPNMSWVEDTSDAYTEYGNREHGC